MTRVQTRLSGPRAWKLTLSKNQPQIRGTKRKENNGHE